MSSQLYDTCSVFVDTMIRLVSAQPNALFYHHHLAMVGTLVKQVKKLDSGKVDPSIIEWRGVVDELEQSLQSEKFYPDKVSRELALEHLAAVKDLLMKVAPKVEVTPAAAPPPPPKPSMS